MKQNGFKDLEPTIAESAEVTRRDVNDDDAYKTRVVRHGPVGFAWLVCVQRRDYGRKYDIGLGVTAIGRDRECEVVLGDDSVSLKHAKIKYVADTDTYMVYDLVSTNGTYVNGERVEAPAQVNDEDEVGFGDVRFVFKRLRRTHREQ
jgi:hypothetical protein